MSHFEPRITDADTLKNYGAIKLKLAEKLDEMGVTPYRLKQLIGSSRDTISRYYRADNIQMIDLGLLAKICYALHCNMSDLLEYVKHEDAEQ